jgi:hypothetical protein
MNKPYLIAIVRFKIFHVRLLVHVQKSLIFSKNWLNIKSCDIMKPIFILFQKF